MICDKYSKVMDVLVKAHEFMERPVRRSDDEPLQKLFVAVRRELNFDPKNLKQEQAKFWKQYPPIIKVTLFPLSHCVLDDFSMCLARRPP